MTCPLCRSSGADPFTRVHDRAYHRCGACHLVFLEPSMLPGPSEERARYETHENDPGDLRYRSFLDRLATPLLEHLHAGAEGLDYGSGPGPTLSVMLEEQGFAMTVYDPFFAPDPAALERTYDFVTCTETVEHFFQPAREFDRIERLLRPGGWLGVMTGVLHEDIVFEDWWYVRDPTHVCFYTPETFRWIANRYRWRLSIASRNVILFQRLQVSPPGTPPVRGG